MPLDVRLDTKILDSITSNLDKNTDKALGDIAKQVVAHAKIRTPRDPARPPKDLSAPTTEQLREGNAYERIKHGLWWAYNSVEYAVWQELGTSRMPGGRPFLAPAIYKVYGEITRKFYGLFK